MASASLQPERFGRVGVVMGGWSPERDVSLRSGQAVAAALASRGIDVVSIDADRDVINTLAAQHVDRVFLILHGTGGEDGTIQGALELAGIPYTGSGVLGSALAMNKLRTKQVCRDVGVPTPAWTMVTDADSAVSAATDFGFPVIVKPIAQGSSIGVSKVMGNEVTQAFALASQYGEVMVETFVEGREVTASILDGEVLPLISMSTSRVFYDYDAKYNDDGTHYECPCHLPDDVTATIKRHALTAFQAVGASGWGRADFMVDAENRPWFIELNTLPGMTDHSLVPMAAQAHGLGFGELCERILSATLDTVATEEAMAS